MVQPVVQEMLATVHASGSSLLGLFSSCTTFDSTAISGWVSQLPAGAEGGGVDNTTAGCNGGRCMVVPCESIGEWAVRVPVGQRRFRRSLPALRPRIRRRRDWVVHCQIPPSV
eukprot:scaffold4566_cov118-Isochrysis_galbana.AAC.6